MLFLAKTELVSLAISTREKATTLACLVYRENTKAECQTKDLLATFSPETIKRNTSMHNRWWFEKKADKLLRKQQMTVGKEDGKELLLF